MPRPFVEGQGVTVSGLGSQQMIPAILNSRQEVKWAGNHPPEEFQFPEGLDRVGCEDIHQTEKHPEPGRTTAFI